MLADSPQGACEKLVGEEIPESGDLVSGPIPNLGLPATMSGATIAGFDLAPENSEVQVIEEFEGGTVLCTVTSFGSMTIEALMMKADAFSATAAGEVTIVDADFNDHYATVQLEVEIEVLGQATANPEYEGIEDFTLDAIEVLGP